MYVWVPTYRGVSQKYRHWKNENNFTHNPMTRKPWKIFSDYDHVIKWASIFT